jgi:hypothetical protein
MIYLSPYRLDMLGKGTDKRHFYELGWLYRYIYYRDTQPTSVRRLHILSRTTEYQRYRKQKYRRKKHYDGKSIDEKSVIHVCHHEKHDNSHRCHSDLHSQLALSKVIHCAEYGQYAYKGKKGGTDKTSTDNKKDGE